MAKTASSTIAWATRRRASSRRSAPALLLQRPTRVSDARRRCSTRCSGRHSRSPTQRCDAPRCPICPTSRPSAATSTTRDGSSPHWPTPRLLVTSRSEYCLPAKRLQTHRYVSHTQVATHSTHIRFSTYYLRTFS